MHGVKISIFMSFRLGRASRGSYAGKLGRQVIAVIKSANDVYRQDFELTRELLKDGHKDIIGFY